jgi:hypothetical protein
VDGLLIAARFGGPPGSANGGIVAGLLAGTGPAEVTLRRPVPVETELTRRDGILSGPDGEVLAECRPVGDDALPGELPAPVAVEVARAAAAATPLRDGHPFPTCFGCGPDNASGLHNLCGPVPGRDGVWACDWTPDTDDPVVTWSALDCPSSAPVSSPGGDPPIVLGRIAGAVLETVVPGEPHVVVSWRLGVEGRKRFAASAVIGPDGRPRAVARATWVALRR